MSKWWPSKTVSASAHFTRGTRALESGDFAQAVKDFEEAIRLDPKQSPAHNNLAFALFQLRDESRAWFHLRQAVLIDPSNEQATASFDSYWAYLERSARVRLGAPISELLSVLGQPDLSNESEPPEFIYIWGLRLIRVRAGVVASVESGVAALARELNR